MINENTLLNWPFEDVVQQLSRRDAAIYALGVGLGTDPLDEGQLRYVRQEDNLAFPTMAVVLCRGKPWPADPRSGIDYSKMVHGEQGLELLRPLPVEGRVRGHERIAAVVDKGEGKGAVIYSENLIVDDATGEPIARTWRSLFARANGGFGGRADAPRSPHSLPQREPDAICDLPTFVNQALFYRLNGDLNPLHSYPQAALKAGFNRPILHGLCSFGVAAHAVMRTYCGYDATRMKAIDVRFSAPVFPGETLSIEMWRDENIISFRAFVRARDVKVLDSGKVIVQ